MPTGPPTAAVTTERAAPTRGDQDDRAGVAPSATSSSARAPHLVEQGIELARTSYGREDPQAEGEPVGGQQRGQVDGAVAAPVGLERLVVPAVVPAVEVVVDVGGDVGRLVGEAHHVVVVGGVLAQQPRRGRRDRARERLGGATAPAQRGGAVQRPEDQHLLAVERRRPACPGVARARPVR